ncbi:hypothetical protein SPRG_11635 [Saprolegnia parasitica CBS 223.65]|uniref:Uncharacterized protein n=1 Tax=Saprolegnia parasitica (strain CBS 223.65) TaxID=695850 RepID=A0A067C9V8_SAPPC|nr:hypothetical protein SPRG_11635 [Saprolegnia parasitica CBS 223.65]KDO23321.1 hypothetical protein SPRG_11635 [Saprolegnia parasitica CBS 223.65]|eukprot:XP_012205973.1 hypothetical protein SPRG_11635 [Saprolegnia parasitica CBS 223.65]
MITMKHESSQQLLHHEDPLDGDDDDDVPEPTQVHAKDLEATPVAFSADDVSMLHYYLESADEEGMTKHLQERKRLDRHRINNIRHRQRKQCEHADLRKMAEAMEHKLRVLQARAARRKATTHMDPEETLRNIEKWKEATKSEKRRREEAVEEKELLTASTTSHRGLIQMYYKRILVDSSVLNNPLLLENEPFVMNTLIGCDHTRAQGYRWISGQMHRQLDVALSYLHSYIGHTIEEKTKIFLGDSSVDLVRHRMWPCPFAVVAQSGWESFTRMSTGNLPRKTSSLEVIDVNTCYTRILIEDGIGPNQPLTLNMLQRRFVEDSRVVITFRTIAEDSTFPLNNPIEHGDLSIAGWLSFERVTDSSARCRVFVKFRSTVENDEEVVDLTAIPSATATNRKTRANQWIMSIIAKMYDAVDTATLRGVNAPAPATPQLEVLRKTEQDEAAQSP